MLKYTMTNIKAKFPIFKNHPELIYVDNAATTQKPESVINAIKNYYENSNANVSRGIYPLAEESTEIYEKARRKVAKFINADPEEIIFVSGATEGLNFIISNLFNNGFLNEESEVVVSELEHNSSFLPIRSRIKGEIDFLRLNEEFKPRYEDLEKKYQLAMFPEISNVTGGFIDPKIMKKHAEIVVVDATQSIGHKKIDVKATDIDFLTFSGHKMYGPMGIGIVFGKKEILKQINPDKLGGGTVTKATKDHFDLKSIPYRFESGTPNVAGAAGLSSAIDFIEAIGFQELHKHEKSLSNYFIAEIKKIDEVILVHEESEESGAVVSFYTKNVHPHDLASFLADNNICVRAGQHCAHIFHGSVIQTPATVRVSFGIYNSTEEVDIILKSISEAIKLYSKN